MNVTFEYYVFVQCVCFVGNNNKAAHFFIPVVPALYLISGWFGFYIAKRETLVQQRAQKNLDLKEKGLGQADFYYTHEKGK